MWRGKNWINDCGEKRGSVETERLITEVMEGGMKVMEGGMEVRQQRNRSLLEELHLSNKRNGNMKRRAEDRTTWKSRANGPAK